VNSLLHFLLENITASVLIETFFSSNTIIKQEELSVLVLAATLLLLRVHSSPEVHIISKSRSQNYNLIH